MNQKRSFQSNFLPGHSCAGGNPFAFSLLKLFLLLGFMFLVVACRQEQTEQIFIPAVKIDEPEASETPPLSDVETAVSQPTAESTTEIFIPALQSDGAGESETANADVTFVAAKTSDGRNWTFNVTVAHPDTGWEDYADGWDVVLPDGTVIKPDSESPFTRLLLHPHETEQPFTRSQSGILIPPEVTSVSVRAHDLVAGFGGKEIVVDLTAVSGQGYTVER